MPKPAGSKLRQLPDFCHRIHPREGKELPHIVAEKTRRRTDKPILVLFDCTGLDCIVYTIEQDWHNEHYQSKSALTCHPERSEGSLMAGRSFAALRMTFPALVRNIPC